MSDSHVELYSFLNQKCNFDDKKSREYLEMLKKQDFNSSD